MRLAWRFWIVGIWLFAQASSAQERYTFTAIGGLGGTRGGQAMGINDVGQVCGYAYLPNDVLIHAFRYDQNGTHDLGTIDSFSSYARRINSAGEIAGISDSIKYGTYHGVIFDGTGVRELPGTGYSDATSINDHGDVVGIKTSFGNNLPTLWRNGQATGLGTLGGPSAIPYDINNAGQITGISDTTALGGNRDAQRAFLVDSNGSMRSLGTLGGTNSFGFAINEQGHVVGRSDTAADAAQHAFLYDGQQMRDFGNLGGYECTAADINEFDQIVGSSQLSGNLATHAFVVAGQSISI